MRGQSEEAFRRVLSAVLLFFAGCSADSGSGPSLGAGGADVTGTGGTPAGSGGAGASDTGGTAGAGGAPLFSACTAAELAAACSERECGAVSTCQGSCGECPADQVCAEGRCAFANCEGEEEDCACGDIHFQLPTRQSCSLGLLAGAEVDGEAFISIGGQDHRILAMNRWGKGHLIAWCDASTTGLLWNAFNVSGYLGQRAEPKVASFGNRPTCEPGFLQGTSIPDSIEYLGTELPAQYLGQPGQLAADWDALVFCGYHTEWDPAWASLLASYVTEHGRGLLAVMDYVGFDITPLDFQNMSAVTSPAGITFNAVSLDWADLTLDVAIECVADLPPPIVH